MTMIKCNNCETQYKENQINIVECSECKTDKYLMEQYKKEDMTNKQCPNCSSYLYNETIKEIDYPLVCLECDENFYNMEVA